MQFIQKWQHPDRYKHRVVIKTEQEYVKFLMQEKILVQNIKLYLDKSQAEESCQINSQIRH